MTPPAGPPGTPGAPPLRRWLAVVLVLAASLLCWYRILGYGFTDVDTFALIASGRVRSGAAAAAVFTRPLMPGRQTNSAWYRPLTTLSYGLDEAVWGLHPLGYHLTDLLLHTFNSLLVLLLGRLLWGCYRPRGPAAAPADREWVPLLGALLFAVHPVHLENVPAIARRADLLATFFVLLTLVALYSYLSSGHRRRYGAALVFAVAAMAAKESGLVTPALVGLALLSVGGIRRWRRAAVLTAPFAASALAFLGWREHVIGGLGGYQVVAYPLGRRLLYSLWHHVLGLALPGESIAWEPLVTTVQAAVVAHPLLTAAAAALLAFEVWRVVAPVTYDPASLRLLAFLAGAPVLLLLVYLPAVFVPRYLYPTVAFFTLLVAWSLVAGWRLAWRRWPRVDARGAAVALALGMATVLAASLLITSPLLRLWPNDKWEKSAAIGAFVLDQADRLLADTPSGATVYLVNWPYRLRDRRAMPLTTIQLEHSVQGWADLALPARHLKVVGLSYLDLDEPPARLRTVVELDPDGLLSVHELGGGVATRYPWQWLHGSSGEGSLYRYVGPPAGLGLRIQLTRAALARSAVFLVYLGDRVELRRPGSWRLVSAAARAHGVT